MSNLRARACLRGVLAYLLVVDCIMGEHAGGLLERAAPLQDECNVLSEQQCRSTCVPRGDAPFECGDWWSNEKCCNGTEAQELPTATYFRCTCHSRF